MALTALKRAIAIRRPPRGVVHHSDRGSQYCAKECQNLLKKYGYILSMSAKGNRYDIAIGHYIEAFYNPKRRHSALGYKSPVQFERQTLKVGA